MNFTTNYENVGTGSGLLPEGLYECVIKSAAIDTTKNGTEYFDVRFVIRNDIQDQKYANKYIFHSICIGYWYLCLDRTYHFHQ